MFEMQFASDKNFEHAHRCYDQALQMNSESVRMVLLPFHPCSCSYNGVINPRIVEQTRQSAFISEQMAGADEVVNTNRRMTYRIITTFILDTGDANDIKV